MTSRREMEISNILEIHALYAADADAHIARMTAAEEEMTTIRRDADYVPMWIGASDPAVQAKGRDAARKLLAAVQAWRATHAASLDMAGKIATASRGLRSGLGRGADELLEELRFAASDLLAAGTTAERLVEKLERC